MASGYQANVVAGAPIASSWGNTIRDRSVMVFDTVAQRDAQIAAPTDGMVCYVIATKTPYQHNGAAWIPLTAGRLLAEHTLAAGTPTILAEQVAMTCSVTLAAPRWLRLAANVVGSKPGASSSGIRVRLRQTNLAGTELKQGYMAVGTNATFTMHVELAVQGVAGPQTFVTTIQTDVDTARLNSTSQLAIYDGGLI